jgi:hypothetical protein
MPSFLLLPSVLFLASLVHTLRQFYGLSQLLRRPLRLECSADTHCLPTHSPTCSPAQSFHLHLYPRLHTLTHYPLSPASLIRVEIFRSSNSWGALVWQLNDIYPSGSWGSLEYGAVGARGQVSFFFSF